MTYSPQDMQMKIKIIIIGLVAMVYVAITDTLATMEETAVTMLKVCLEVFGQS